MKIKSPIYLLSVIITLTKEFSFTLTHCKMCELSFSLTSTSRTTGYINLRNATVALEYGQLGTLKCSFTSQCNLDQVPEERNAGDRKGEAMECFGEMQTFEHRFAWPHT